MIRLVDVTLESEMDLVLTHQKFLKIAEALHLSLSTRSTFASAISEVVRVMTDHTDKSILHIGVIEDDLRFKLACEIIYPSKNTFIDDNLFYFAKKLVPFFHSFHKGDLIFIEFFIGLPKSLNLSTKKIQQIQSEMLNMGPISTYEELKNNKNILFQKSELQKAELIAAKKLNDLKSEFISMASHELKTPITILKAYGQLGLSSKIQTVEQARHIINKMNTQCIKLSILALQFLESAKIENGQLEYQMVTTDFNIYLSQTLEDLKHLIPNHSLHVDLGLSSAIRFDPLRIEQVLSNLISNAAKYSAVHTNIFISTTIVEENQRMILSITDEGIGIDEDGLLKIFEKFHRQAEVVGKQSGLGMGMYIASEIIHGHGGKLWVDSKKGVGSTFHMSLPIL